MDAEKKKNLTSLEDLIPENGFSIFVRNNRYKNKDDIPKALKLEAENVIKEMIVQRKKLVEDHEKKKKSNQGSPTSGDKVVS